jgi:hypothetical protein
VRRFAGEKPRSAVLPSPVPRKQRFKNDGAGKGIKHRLDTCVLRRLYVTNGRTQASIAREYGCSPQFISLLLAEYGIDKARTGRSAAVLSQD